MTHRCGPALSPSADLLQQAFRYALCTRSCGTGPVTAEQILAERFARGEIDEDEFWQRMTTLRAGRADDPTARDS